MSYTYQRGGTYKSRNTEELEKLRNKYIDQSENYDPTKDNAYQEYASMMRDQGNKAMESAMARASANSGGYGNSYAQTVGQQVLNDYSKEIGAAQETYYDRAMNKILNQMNMLENRETADKAAWEEAYLNDITEAQKANDYSALAEIYGFDSEADYLDSLRTELPSEEVDNFINALSEGRGEEYFQYLEDKNYNTDNIYLEASARGYKGDAGDGRIVVAKDADDKAITAITSNAINSGIRGSKDSYETGEKFHISVTGDDYDVQLGEAANDANVKAIADKMNGESLFIYNGILYHTAAGTVHAVEPQKGRTDEYRNLIEAIREDLKKTEE